MKLNGKELKSFFYGTLLGDSYLYHGTFCCKQITKSLIYFKGRIIQKYFPYCGLRIKEYDGYTDKNGVNHQKYYQLTTTRTEYFKKLQNKFYPNGKKIVTKDMIQSLTPIGYAMWYADDGTTVLVTPNQNGAKSRRIQFCTDGFTKEENLLIKKEWESIFDKITVIDRKRKEQVRLQISPRDGQKLFNEIYPYFLYFPEMLYKLDLGYRYSSLENRRYVSKEYQDLFLKISAHPSFIDRIAIKTGMI